MTSKRQLLRTQRSWALSRGLKPDMRGYLAEVTDNLYRPLSATALAAFEDGGSAELNDRPDAPAKMKALHSSAALVVNFFDYWTERACTPLLQALGIHDPLRSPPRFEAKLPTGLAGNPPNLDVLLNLKPGALIGIESKFTEWLSRKRRGREPFKPKYFEDGVDLPCPASKTHREELLAFGDRVGAELRFEPLTYQELFRRLCESARADASYLAYLESRYFAHVHLRSLETGTE